MLLDEALDLVARARADNPLQPVTFITPTRVAALALRRDLAQRRSHAGVRFETLPRLAELAGAGLLAASGLRPLARPIGDYVAGVVARESGGTLAGIAGLPGYARVLRRHFQRLRRGGIRASGDLQVAPGSGAVAEFLRAYDAFREVTRGFYDDEDLLDAAAAAVREGSTGIAADLGEVYVVAPGPRTPGGRAFLDGVAGRGCPVTLLTERGGTREPRVVLMPDPGSEAERVVRAVLELLERGAPLHDVAVFHGADPAYGPLLAETFERARVPLYRSPGRPLLETPAGRAAMALIRTPWLDYSRVAVMDFLALAQTPQTLPTGEGTAAVRSTAWDRVSREAGVTHGAARWEGALEAFAADREASAATRSEGDQRSVRDREAAATARTLAGVVAELAARLEPLRRPQAAAAFIVEFRAVLDDYLWRGSEGRTEVLEEVDQLGTVAAVGGSFSLESFALAFEANLGAAAIRQGSLGEGVLIADYRMAAGLAFPHVVVCGAFEGAFPAGPGVEPVVDDRWWAGARAVHPDIEDTRTRTERERAAALRCLAAATGSLTITVPLAAAGGTQDRYPAPVVAETVSRAAGRLVTPTAIRGGGVVPGVVRVRSPIAAAVAGPVIDRFELELREAIAPRQHSRWQLDEGHRLARPAALRRQRRATSLNEWDGLVPIDGPPAPAGRELSPTAAETYASCGFRYFLRHVLGLSPVEEPEERQTMDPATRGTIVHRVLERFFRAEHERGRPAAGEPWTTEDESTVLRLLDAEVDAAQVRGQAGLPIFHAHERTALRADLERFLREDTVYRLATGAQPAAFEWEFQAVEIGGRRFRGKADRVDVAEDGKRAWVIDYKTGKNDNPNERERERDPFDGGRRLQLGVYAEAWRAQNGGPVEVTGRYWYVSQRGAFDTVDYRHSAANARLLAKVVSAIEEGVRAGVFPAVPGEEDPWYGGFTNCRYCDFDRVCSQRRLTDFTARAGGTSLQPWLRVAVVARGDESA
jgi:hypothetical protein